MPSSLAGHVSLAFALGALGCSTDEPLGEQSIEPPIEPLDLDYTTTRDPCRNTEPLRRAFFGDLHVHTALSFDAGAYDTRVTPEEAYLFARGNPIYLPPLDNDGKGTRRVELLRALDFAAVTDHSEFLGEIYQCTTEGARGYHSAACKTYRDPESNGALQFGNLLANTPERLTELCGKNGEGCEPAARRRWQELQVAAEEAYDRTDKCAFTSFVAYEYTNTRNVSNLHRNVLFANVHVPELPISYFEADPLELWKKLDEECISADTGCDALSIPHNSNLSSGRLFTPTFPEGASEAEQREISALRARVEPIAEIFQHKGDSECRNGHAGTGAEADDPLCEFEKLRPPDAELCGEELGAGGMRLLGCSHRLDFLRNVLVEGLKERERIGVNPYHFGFIGSTDTHNGAPGMVSSDDFPGHIGNVDDTAVERLGYGNVTHDGIINNPGGLAGVWAEENSRPALFAALRRGETFATSGPRIEVRFFGGWDLAGLCDESYDVMVAAGYDRGVPMGSDLPNAPTTDAAPTFVIHARADDFGVPLERIQIIKGFIDEDGKPHERVIDVDQLADALLDLDTDTCEPPNEGWTEHCQTWADPDFDPDEPAFYYARVLEAPTCRWSTPQCQALSEDQRPPECTSDIVPQVVRHRAWASPIWFTPG